MLKILNKMLLLFKNILLFLALIITIYIIMFMYKRLDKDLASNLMEFVSTIIPFILLIILNFLNMTLKQKNVNDNIFYNITSFLVVFTILIFCIRTLGDQNMYFWHKYDYKMNFNYFSDQIAPIKIMLYSLSVSNILLMIVNSIKIEKNELKKINLT